MADHGCPRLGQDLGGPSPRVEEEEQHGFIAEPGPLTIASGPEQCGDLRWVKCGLDECRRLRWLDPRKRVFGREILGVKPGAERPQGAGHAVDGGGRERVAIRLGAAPEMGQIGADQCRRPLLWGSWMPVSLHPASELRQAVAMPVNGLRRLPLGAEMCQVGRNQRSNGHQRSS